MPPVPFDNSYARLPDNFFKKVNPAVPPSPKLIRANTELASFLGIDLDWFISSDGLAMVSGQKLPDGADPIAMAYAGHQFGHFSQKLGDGRAVLIGEVIAQDGVRRDIQLKGSGHTPFSRSGDGKSALGPVLREYIVSEYMATLGVPTTRALAAVTTGENVIRNGLEPGGVFTRVAKSHVRIGTFQYFSARQDQDAVKTLADYIIDRHYPEATKAENPYVELLRLVGVRQAELIAKWMSFGFIHGVMNTDNVQIAGETIDYGPCAFMDDFHPEKVFSSIDQQGRYAWGNQSRIGKWNLAKFAETLLFLIDDDEENARTKALEAIQNYDDVFSTNIFINFSHKLGLLSNDERQNDLISKTVEVMTVNEVDFTLFFRHLTKICAGGSTDYFCSLFNDPVAAEEWLSMWNASLVRDDGSNHEEQQKKRIAVMRACNPVLIPRNHRIEEAIEAGNHGDFKTFHRLVDALSKPCDDQDQYADLEQPPELEEIVHQTFCGT